MSRRSERMAQDAAREANEAAKVVTEVTQETTEATPEQQEIKPVRPRNEANEQAHAEIEKRYLQTLGVKEDGSPVEPEKSEPEEVKDEQPPEKPEEKPEEKHEPQLVKQIVDGEEFNVSQEEIDEAGGARAWRISKAADNRLKKANDAVAQARKIQDELAQFAVQQLKATQPQQPQITDDQFIAQKMDQIRYGTPEEGAVALREILTRTQQKAPDPQLITAQAVAQMTRKLAVDRFKDEFSDISTNPDLLQFAAVMEQQMLSQVQPQALLSLDWNQHYRNIGNKIRSIVGKPSQPATATPTQGNPSQSSKEERKASITVLPTAAARAEVKVEKVLTPEEARQQAIAEMRAASSKLKGEATG